MRTPEIESPRYAAGGLGRADEHNNHQHRNSATHPEPASEARVVADSGAVLEWVDAHRGKHGWQPGKWEVVERALSVGARPRPASVVFDSDVAKQLVSSREFAFAWEIAKDLAPLPPRLARSDISASWEAISERVDPLLVLDTVNMIRSAAIERYVDAETVARAVERLLDAVDREVRR